ncbi:hypothetical protein [Ligilactobacillus ceti]|uniref:Uncharacterized protein n=1 Tax=Ligilactobacillus ceti DSM 22408 TaxID=1122146 RepID=A0A0R2KHP6_9LACO|nr:hypothetical protein [Ligilactobacillus ceti]KRN88865.1 hypothetical protein IV53_GL000835 [Ligilactobacillus ceti DSM 22408]
MAVTESKKKANLKWDNANKERKQYLNRRSTCRNFIKKLATLEDLEEIEQLLQDRKNMLENS